MKKKILSVVLCVSMLATMMVGCGKKETPATEPDSTKTEETNTGDDTAKEETPAPAAGEITYWSMWQNTEPQAKVIEEAAAAYEKETGVKVNIEWKGRDITKLIAPAIQGGEKIDIFDDDYMRISQDHSKFTADLTDLAAAANYENYAMPVLVNANKSWTGGKLTAIGYQPYTTGIFYDKALFAKAGIEKEPATWSEFLDVCQKLKDAGIQPLAVDDAYVRFNLGFQLARYIGQDAVKDVVNNGKWAEEPAVLKAAQDLLDLKEKGYLAESAPAVYPKGENEIGFGKTAMVVNASWVPNEINNNTQADIDWGMFSYPALDGGVDGTEAATVGAQAFAVSNKSEHPQEAFDFIMKLTTGEFDKKMSDATNSIPADKNNTEWPKLVQSTQESFLALTKQYDWNCGLNDNPDMAETIQANTLKLFEGKFTAQQFVDAMEKASK